jgi:predicted AAA+ superfamily ATPase
LKFFKEYKGIDVICSGSVLGTSGYSNSFVPIGAEDILRMYPMTFFEFCVANGQKQETMLELYSYFKKHTRIPKVFNNTFNELLKKYSIVGGMPEIVEKYLKNKDIYDCVELQEKILLEFKDNIAKYAPNTEKIKARECFENIPIQLSKDNTTFQYSLITSRTGARLTTYENSLK